MDISAEIADTLRKHKILTASVMTGKASPVRVCFGPEPVRTKALSHVVHHVHTCLSRQHLRNYQHKAQ
eukprot:12890435-Prorocentrum_lima.AAC.1